MMNAAISRSTHPTIRFEVVILFWFIYIGVILILTAFDYVSNDLFLIARAQMIMIFFSMSRRIVNELVLFIGRVE